MFLASALALMTTTVPTTPSKTPWVYCRSFTLQEPGEDPVEFEATDLIVTGWGLGEKANRAVIAGLSGGGAAGKRRVYASVLHTKADRYYGFYTDVEPDGRWALEIPIEGRIVGRILDFNVRLEEFDPKANDWVRIAMPIKKGHATSRTKD